MELQSIIPILKSNDVAFAGVFGSHARGESNDNSDIDLLIRFSKPKSLLDLVRIEREISEKIGGEVDLVTEQSLSPYIRGGVLRDLKVVYGER